LYWQLSDNNADVSEVARDIRSVKKKIKDSDVPIWDRLGNSGRKQKPHKQHHNPMAIAITEGNGGKVIRLPPQRKYLNPVELLFNDVKNHYIRPRSRKMVKIVVHGN
jgi:hypothetical protein